MEVKKDLWGGLVAATVNEESRSSTWPKQKGNYSKIIVIVIIIFIICINNNNIQ